MNLLIGIILNTVLMTIYVLVIYKLVPVPDGLGKRIAVGFGIAVFTALTAVLAAEYVSHLIKTKSDFGSGLTSVLAALLYANRCASVDKARAHN